MLAANETRKTHGRVRSGDPNKQRDRNIVQFGNNIAACLEEKYQRIKSQSSVRFQCRIGCISGCFDHENKPRIHNSYLSDL